MHLTLQPLLPPHMPSPPLQIIALVQGCGGRDCLPPPDPKQLRAGPLPCWQRYAQLMRACLAPEPENRPKFDAIVRELE